LTKLEEPELNRPGRIRRLRILTNRQCPNAWSRFAMTAMTWLLLLQGCTQSEVKGTYDVEIEIVRATAAIGGTLILSTGILDVPALTDEERATAGDWLESDTIDANSCFVLQGGTSEERMPQNVRVFDARIRNNEVGLPIEIYRTPLQRIEIISLQFFADTIGGEVVLHDRGQQRPGRIHGVRSGSPTPQRCIDDLEIFRVNLRNSLAQ
jgi:hypothetical protein